MHIKILFGVLLKHSSLWPAADVKPVLNNIVHAAPWQCMFALYMCVISENIKGGSFSVLLTFCLTGLD